MVHTRPWSSFALTLLDFKISRGATAAFSCAPTSLTPLPGKDVGFNGIEVQILDTKTAGYYDTGAIYDLSKPSKNAMKPAGEWNHFDITCDKSIIEVVLNGAKVNDVALDFAHRAELRPGRLRPCTAVAYRGDRRTGERSARPRSLCWFKNVKTPPAGRELRRSLAVQSRGSRFASWSGVSARRQPAGDSALSRGSLSGARG